MKKGCYIIMSKSIRISDENYKKLTAIGKGKIDDKFSTLLDQHQQTLIDQSKPSAAKTEEPPTDYFLGLIIRYYYGLGKTIRGEGIYQSGLNKETKGSLNPSDYEGEKIRMLYIPVELNQLEREEVDERRDAFIGLLQNQRRSDLRNNIERVTKENGWHNEYPVFFSDMRNNKGRFQNKIDKCLELLVRNEVLERIEVGYTLVAIPTDEVEIAKLEALRYQTVTTAPPTIYYKQNQKRKTFEDGSPVPSIDIHLGRFNAPGIMHQDQ